MSEPALDVVEFLLTARRYTDETALDANDLPPRYRRVFWDEEEDVDEGPAGGIERPLVVTQTVARQATGVDRPGGAGSGVLVTARGEFPRRREPAGPEVGRWCARARRGGLRSLLADSRAARVRVDHGDRPRAFADERAAAGVAAAAPALGETVTV